MPTPLELILDPASIGITVLYVLLLASETLFPARALPRIAGWWWRGLLAFAVYFFVSSYLPFLVADALAPFRLFDASGLGTYKGAALALLSYEILGYAWHRAMHGSNFLWRVVHQMHHSSERIDVPSAFWFSPMDMAGWTLVTTLALTIVGVTPGATFLFVMLTSFFGIFQHANIRTPRWLGYVMQRPENHSHHHARGVHTGNFANLSLIDMAFGTFQNHATSAAQTGFGGRAWARVPEMLAFRDVTRDEQSVRPSTAHA